MKSGGTDHTFKVIWNERKGREREREREGGREGEREHISNTVFKMSSFPIPLILPKLMAPLLSVSNSLNASWLMTSGVQRRDSNVRNSENEINLQVYVRKTTIIIT